MGTAAVHVDQADRMRSGRWSTHAVRRIHDTRDTAARWRKAVFVSHIAAGESLPGEEQIWFRDGMLVQDDKYCIAELGAEMGIGAEWLQTASDDSLSWVLMVVVVCSMGKGTLLGVRVAGNKDVSRQSTEHMTGHGTRCLGHHFGCRGENSVERSIPRASIRYYLDHASFTLDRNARLKR